MPNVIAIVPTRLNRTALGLKSLVSQRLAGSTVLEHTVARVARVKQVSKIVLLHGENEDPLSMLGSRDFGKPVCGFVDAHSLMYQEQERVAAARKWSLAAWRGGLGGALCYDELLPAGPMAAMMAEHEAGSALIVGADWLLVDPLICQQVLELHLEHPQAKQMTFTQSPPGLAGIAVGRPLIEGMAKKQGASFGQIIGYSPTNPQADPIGRDVCVQVPAAVRSCVHRMIYDTPATAAVIERLADRLGDQFYDADAQMIVGAVADLGDGGECRFADLPQMVTLELTPRRQVSGPITPQHYVTIDRSDMALSVAGQIVSQLGQDQDTVLTLGGLGDALLYEDWEQVVVQAHEAGVLGIAIETDLLVDQPILERLLELPIDVVSVRLNADRAATYQKVMTPPDDIGDGFAKVIANLQWLINERNRRMREWPITQDAKPTAGRPGLPWVVPRLIKTADTLDDMETFFDRWVYCCGHAVIEPATCACGLAAELSPVRMSPPQRIGCRQVERRMTIHSDGRVAQCDQDWLGRACGGDTTVLPLKEIWRSMHSLRHSHTAGQWDELELCGPCHEWHRP